jgi:hypothetical protein
VKRPNPCPMARFSQGGPVSRAHAAPSHKMLFHRKVSRETTHACLRQLSRGGPVRRTARFYEIPGGTPTSPPSSFGHLVGEIASAARAAPPVSPPLSHSRPRGWAVWPHRASGLQRMARGAIPDTRPPAVGDSAGRLEESDDGAPASSPVQRARWHWEGAPPRLPRRSGSARSLAGGRERRLGWPPISSEQAASRE